MAVSSAVRSAGASQDAAVEEVAASSLLLLRRRTVVDVEVGVELDESAATAATTFDWSSAGQLPTSAANSSLPSAVRTSAMLVADDGTEEAGVEAMMPGDDRRGRRKIRRSRRASVRRIHVHAHMPACAKLQWHARPHGTHILRLQNHYRLVKPPCTGLWNMRFTTCM